MSPFEGFMCMCVCLSVCLWTLSLPKSQDEAIYLRPVVSIQGASFIHRQNDALLSLKCLLHLLWHNQPSFTGSVLQAVFSTDSWAWHCLPHDKQLLLYSMSQSLVFKAYDGDLSSPWYRVTPDLQGYQEGLFNTSNVLFTSTKCMQNSIFVLQSIWPSLLPYSFPDGGYNNCQLFLLVNRIDWKKLETSNHNDHWTVKTPLRNIVAPTGIPSQLHGELL